jgi:hypothetical protein
VIYLITKSAHLPYSENGGRIFQEVIMADVQGPVVALSIRQTAQSSTELDSATVTLLVGSHFLQAPKEFVLWQTVVGECPGPSITIARSLNVSLLREALINKLDVVLTYTSATLNQGGLLQTINTVDAVQLLSSAES